MEITKLRKLGAVFFGITINPDGLIVEDLVIYAIGWPYYGGNSDTDEDEDEDVDEDYHIHSGASFLDLADSSAKWKSIDGMLNSDRSFPSCASLSNKIFVFGASDGTAPFAFGEFYDKKTNNWEPIPFPPGFDHHKQPSVMHPVISDPKHNLVLVYISLINSLYAYYPDNNHNRWVCLDDHLLSWRGEAAPSPVDDVLYFIQFYEYFNTNCITAYDILNNKTLQVTWSACSPFGPNELRRLTFQQMIYLGDNIMCLTADLTLDGSSFFKFYRFRACRVSQEQVSLTPLSVHLIPVEGLNSTVNIVPL
ncbi:hypothetical protein OROMI_005604 [Orobanche minor]